MTIINIQDMHFSYSLDNSFSLSIDTLITKITVDSSLMVQADAENNISKLNHGFQAKQRANQRP